MAKVDTNIIKGLALFGKMNGIYFVTSLINGVIPFLLLPVLTRYMAPEAYGLVAIFNLVLVLSNAIAGLSVRDYVSKHFFSSSEEENARIIGNSLLVVSVLTVFAELLIITGYLLIPQSFVIGIKWLLLIPLASFSFIIFTIGLTVFRNLNKALLFGKYQTMATVLNAGLSLLFVVCFAMGWEGRVGGIVVAHFLSVVMTLFVLRRMGYIKFSFSRPIVKDIFRVSAPLIPNALQSVIIPQVGIFFMTTYYSSAETGVYAASFQIAAAVYFLAATLLMSWSPYLYKALSNMESVNKQYLTRLLCLFASTAIGGALFIIIFGGFIVDLALPEAYSNAKEYLAWLSLGCLFLGLRNFFLPILIHADKQKFISHVSLCGMVLVIVFSLTLKNFWGSVSFAMAFALAHVLMFVAVFIKSQQLFPLPWFKSLNIWSK